MCVYTPSDTGNLKENNFADKKKWLTDATFNNNLPFYTPNFLQTGGWSMTQKSPTNEDASDVIVI